MFWFGICYRKRIFHGKVIPYRLCTNVNPCRTSYSKVMFLLKTLTNPFLFIIRPVLWCLCAGRLLTLNPERFTGYYNALCKVVIYLSMECYTLYSMKTVKQYPVIINVNLAPPWHDSTSFCTVPASIRTLYGNNGASLMHKRYVTSLWLLWCL